MNKSPIGVAVIGAGLAGRLHALGYRNAGSVANADQRHIRLVSIADPNTPLAEDAAAKFGFECTDEGWQAVAENPNIQVVSVVVANTLHREMVEGLLSAGKHVLCEKPLAPTIADGEAMVAAANAATTLARVGFTQRRHVGVQAVRELIESGTLGRPLHFDGQYWSDYAADPAVPITWRYKGDPGSGALADIGCHLGDLGEFMCGPTASVLAADMQTYITDRPVPAGQTVGHEQAELTGETDTVENEDTATWSARFDGGATGFFSVSRVAHGLPNSIRIEVLCEKGVVSWDNSRPGEILLARTREAGYQRILMTGKNTYFSSIGFGSSQTFTSQARSFLDEIDGIDVLPRALPLDHGVHSLKLQQAVVQSARRQTSVAI